MSCDKKNRAVKLAQAKLDEVTATLAEATKQEQDEEKKHADAEAGFIMFVVSSEALGLVSRCRIPTAAVAQRGLFRILLGSGVPEVVSNAINKRVADAAIVAPSAENYSATFANSACADGSYSCWVPTPIDFVSYSIN